MTKVIGWDIETRDVNPHNKESSLISYAFCGDDLHPWGEIIWHPTVNGGKYCNQLVEECSSVLQDPGNIFVGHNVLMFDLFFYWTKVFDHTKPLPKVFDTYIAYSLLSPGQGNSLGNLGNLYTPYQKNEDNINNRRLWKEDPNLVLEYNKQDAKISYALYRPIKKLLKDNHQTKVYSFSMKFAYCLLRMMLKGVHIDRVLLETVSIRI